eukprot:1139412-Pelagomonas_calceolata.AAC.8
MGVTQLVTFKPKPEYNGSGVRGEKGVDLAYPEYFSVSGQAQCTKAGCYLDWYSEGLAGQTPPAGLTMGRQLSLGIGAGGEGGMAGEK